MRFGTALLLGLVGACGFGARVSGQTGDDVPIEPDASTVDSPGLVDAPPGVNSTKRRVELSFNNATRAEGFDNFAALVVLDATKVDYANCVSGACLRFFDSNGTTALPHEIELWDAAGKSYVWVRVPHIDASSDTDHIFMDYGDTALADAQNKPGVWSSDMRAVWHLAEDPGPGTANSMRDSTSNANHGTPTANMGSGDHSAGVVGFGVRFNGNQNGITAATMTLATYSWSMFVRGDSAPALQSSNRQPISNGDTNFNYAWDHSGAAFVAAAAQRDGSAWHSVQPASGLAGATWYHIASTYNGTNLCMYVNGAQTCVASPPPQAPNTGFGFQMGLASSGSSTFTGNIDELRVTSAVYSPLRISAEVANQRANAANPFVVFGAPVVVP